MKRIWVLCLLMILLLCDGSAEQQTQSDLLDVIEMLQEQNEALLIEQQEKEKIIGALKRETDSIAAELDQVRADMNAVIDSHTALNTEYLMAMEYHLIEHEDKAQAYLAMGSVPVRGLPLEKATVIADLHNVLVTAHFTIYGENNVLWSLVDVPNLGENMDTLGWVKWDDLTEYNEQDAEKLMYPVKVKAGTKLFDDRRGVTDYADGIGIYMISQFVTDEMMMILDSGGISYPVYRDDLIYPTVRDGEIVWD